MPGFPYTNLVEKATQAETVEDIHNVGAALCYQLGFDSFCYGAQFPTSLVKPHQILVSGYPKPWLDHYNTKHYIRIDPIIAHCATRYTPAVWADLRPTNDTAKGIADFFSEADDFGLRSGVSVPIHGNGGERAVLSLASEEASKKTEQRINEGIPLAQLLAGYIHEAVCRVFEEEDIRLAKVQLTKREKECLLWTAEGKTSWETSRILNISERTVVFHLQNSNNKLNVCNRQQAVARAVSQGLITPQFD